MLTYCDVTDLVTNATELEKLATRDSLTGLNSRRQFLVLAEIEWTRFQRYQRPLSMLMVDIDHFKSVNDRFGHAVGDEVLSMVAKICQEERRSSDVVGRIGGEEFALLLLETDMEQARIVGERICTTVAAQSSVANGVEFTTTVSIGIASATLRMSGIHALMRATDRALYAAKGQGRNRAVQFVSEPEIHLSRAAE